MEIVSRCTNAIKSRERELMEMAREKKKVECKLEIVEKEKNLIK